MPAIGSTVSVSDLEHTVWDFPAGTPLSHLHGCVCGLCCAGTAPERFATALSEWVAAELPALDSGAARAELRRFCRVAVAELDADDYSFTLLLGDEDADVAMRLADVAEWSAGFLTGFGLGASDAAPGESAREILADIVEISRVDTDSGADAHAEFDLFDVVEHLRVGVLTLRAGLTEAGDDDR